MTTLESLSTNEGSACIYLKLNSVSFDKPFKICFTSLFSRKAFGFNLAPGISP